MVGYRRGATYLPFRVLALLQQRHRDVVDHLSDDAQLRAHAGLRGDRVHEDLDEFHHDQILDTHRENGGESEDTTVNRFYK